MSHGSEGMDSSALEGERMGEDFGLEKKAEMECLAGVDFRAGDLDGVFAMGSVDGFDGTLLGEAYAVDGGVVGV